VNENITTKKGECNRLSLHHGAERATNGNSIVRRPTVCARGVPNDHLLIRLRLQILDRLISDELWDGNAEDRITETDCKFV